MRSGCGRTSSADKAVADAAMRSRTRSTRRVSGVVRRGSTGAGRAVTALSKKVIEQRAGDLGRSRQHPARGLLGEVAPLQRNGSAAGADVKLGAGVASVHEDRVDLDDERPPRSHGCGVVASLARCAETIGVDRGEVAASMSVRPPLSTPALCIGDAANIPGSDGSTLPRLGQIAQRSGR
jgi:hypothetical protein